MNLTSRQYEVLDFIKKFIAKNGFAPTIREIAQGVGIKSPSTAQDYLRKLVKEGIVTTANSKSRSIELLVQNEYLTKTEKIVPIPLLNKKDNAVIKEFLDIPVFMLNEYNSKNIYAFKDKKIIYLVNHSLKNATSPSLVIKDDELCIENAPENEIFGNIISEFKLY